MTQIFQVLKIIGLNNRFRRWLDSDFLNVLCGLPPPGGFSLVLVPQKLSILAEVTSPPSGIIINLHSAEKRSGRENKYAYYCWRAILPPPRLRTSCVAFHAVA